MALILRTPHIDDAKRILRGTRQGAPVPEGHVSSPATIASSADVDAELTLDLPKVPDVAALVAREQYLAERLREVEEAGERAYEKGYETGLRSGETEGREAYTSGLRQLEELTQNLNLSVQRSIEESEDMMVSIVFESVCKIVGDTLATPEGVSAIVKEALARIRGKSAVIIRVNPLDLELIEESAAFGIASEADWRSDEGIPMGGCLIESEYGTLDARIDTQLNQLKRVLLAARHKPIDSAKNN